MNQQTKGRILSILYAGIGICIGLAIANFTGPAFERLLKTPDRVTALEQRLEYVAHLQEEEIAIRRLSKMSGEQKTSSCDSYMQRYTQRNQAVPESIGAECGLVSKSPQEEADEMSTLVLAQLAKEGNKQGISYYCNYFTGFYKDNGLALTHTMLMECKK
jgi:hypothetical protein